MSFISASLKRLQGEIFLEDFACGASVSVEFVFEVFPPHEVSKINPKRINNKFLISKMFKLDVTFDHII